ncbi:MAG: hypothetical protein U0414_25565 [Polyangiaceae bacterium]
MRLHHFLLIAGVGGVAGLIGCDDASTGSGGSTSASSSSSGKASSSSSGGNMCIQPGDPGNDIGVGHACTPGGGECMQFPLASLCLADVGQDEHFCTRIGCDEKTNCGKDAGCLIEGAGSACVPCKCDSAGIGCSTTSTTSSSSSSGSSSSASTGTGP